MSVSNALIIRSEWFQWPGNSSFTVLTCLREKKNAVQGEEGARSTVWRRSARSSGSIRMHPTSTPHTIRPVLHFANLYPGCWFRVFPWKKKSFFFLESVCFHEQEWLRLTNKPLFPCSQMLTEGPSSDLQLAKRHTGFNALQTVKK